MSKKTCDALLCNNQTPTKYRYCYDCAKRKGLVGGNTNWLGLIVVILILLWIF